LLSDPLPQATTAQALKAAISSFPNDVTLVNMIMFVSPKKLF
jgi:hypothetical protein